MRTSRDCNIKIKDGAAERPVAGQPDLRYGQERIAHHGHHDTTIRGSSVLVATRFLPARRHADLGTQILSVV